MVSACQAAGVEIVGLTDHFRVATSKSLADALEAAGIKVFLGFEANSSEGVHLLCLFGRDMSIDQIGRVIGACGVVDLTAKSPQSDKTCEQLLDLIPRHGGVAIAAHVCAANGLLDVLKGQSRARAWKSKDLLAVALPGARDGAPQNYRSILLNKDPEYERERPVAVINANDVSDPAALSEPSATTLIKVADVSIEGLRQAFLDWESRIRLASDDPPLAHIELIAASWSGGFLDGQCLRFNEGLNVLIGGRGAGKSTLIESLRYAFEQLPQGDDAKKAHDSMMKSVFGPGASIAVLVKSPSPSPQYYLLERIHGARTKIRDQSGNLLGEVPPSAVLGKLEVYGQHEISELTRRPEKLAELLRRFTPTTDLDADKASNRTTLVKSRKSIISQAEEVGEIENALAALPELNMKLKQFEDAGLDKKLSEKAQFDDEKRILDAAEDVSQSAADLATGIEGYNSGGDLVAADAELPNKDLLAPLNAAGARLARRVARAAKYVRLAKADMDRSIEQVRSEWLPKSEEADTKYQAILRELKAAGQDGTQFITVRDQIERLKPKETELAEKSATLDALKVERRELVDAWEKLKAEDYRQLQRAAREVSSKLKNRVRVSVRPSQGLGPVEEAIRRHCTGNFSQALNQLRAKQDLSLSDFASDILAGAPKLVAVYGFTSQAAERIAEGGMKLALEIEECEVPPEAVLELNVGSDQVQVWKELDSLSTGQKATAVLLLLLLESNAPLIVDQPEDDLDNRFITECIVPSMRGEKMRRQFLFSSHNANIPVLGDAEQIVGLTPKVEGGVERAEITEGLCGSIDTPLVKELVKDLLEGGQAAFELRKQKYGF